MTEPGSPPFRCPNCVSKSTRLHTISPPSGSRRIASNTRLIPSSSLAVSIAEVSGRRRASNQAAIWSCASIGSFSKADWISATVLISESM